MCSTKQCTHPGTHHLSEETCIVKRTIQSDNESWKCMQIQVPLITRAMSLLSNTTLCKKLFTCAHATLTHVYNTVKKQQIKRVSYMTEQNTGQFVLLRAQCNYKITPLKLSQRSAVVRCTLIVLRV